MNAGQSLVDRLSRDERRALLARLLRERSSTITCPLSHGQRALWYIAQTNPTTSAYNVAFGVRLLGTVDVSALRRALQTIVERHSALRTTFAVRGGQPVQEIHTHRDLELEVEVGAWSDVQLDERVQVLARRVFDLSRDRPFRASLLVRSDREAILLLSAHHIVVDAWSLGVLMDELRVLYGAEVVGEPARLPAPTAQYVDFVRWQAGMLAGPDGVRHEQYWRQQLAGVLPILELPTDRPRPDERSLTGASETVLLDGPLVERLRALAQAETCTLYSLLLAAFNVLLYRYTGQADIIVLSPMSGRTRRALDTAVGYFVSPVALRSTCTDTMSFRAYLRSVHETTLAALEHQDYPFALLVQKLNPRRVAGHAPVSDVLFNVLQLRLFDGPTRTSAATVAGAAERDGVLRVETFPVAQEEGQFDLALEIIDLGATLCCGLKYSTELYESQTAARLLEHYRTLLAAIVEDPNASLSTLRLLSAPERRQLLEEWNATSADYPRDRCLHELFEAQADRAPDAVAVCFGDERLTYRELDARANRLATQLRRLDVGPDVLVGLCVNRSTRLVIGMLGILKAGGAYLPLDPSYPSERLAFMLHDAAVPVVVTERSAASLLPESAAHVVDLDALDTETSDDAGGRPASGVSPNHLAYVMYTSGSTGLPKGVMIPHRATVNFLTALDRILPAAPTDVVCAVTSISFDIAVLELLWPLIRGACTTIVADPVSRAPGSGASAPVGTESAVVATLEHALNEGTTILQCTPSMMRLVLQDRRTAATLSQVQVILLGGEPVSPALVTEIRRQTAARIFNMYGPTETTVWSTVREIDSPGEAGLIGRPLANTQLYIVDRAGQPVPVGVPGELLIGGDGLARGYLNRPELTAERFIHNPFAGRAAARLYRTGDLVRYRPDGLIEFLGRLDRQVKLRGHRIELAEIEVQLAQFPGIGDTAVLVREDSPGDERLVAYVTSRGDEAPSPGQLRRFLRTRLPEYMVPSLFVRLQALPLTPNGKLDRRSLPAPTTSGSHDAVRSVGPRSPLEERIAEILGQALGGTPVRPRETFADLGGHSLLAAQVAARIEADIGVRLNPGLILMQTPAQLAETCRERLTDRGAGSPSTANGVQGRLQERLLRAAGRLLPGTSAPHGSASHEQYQGR